jgi:hypothetical protein
MAMTPYSGDTSVIGQLGTTPQERGLTTQQFKDKFDEGLKAFVEWFNLTHKTEFDAHMADTAKLSGYAEYSKNGTQSIAQGVQTTLTLTEVKTNENVTFLSGTNEIQIVNAGQYEIKVQLKTSAAATHGFGIYPRRNGINMKYFISLTKNFQHSFFYSLNANDKITFVVLHNEASAIDVISDSETYFQIKKVG